jgi:hypothetical protein
MRQTERFVKNVGIHKNVNKIIIDYIRFDSVSQGHEYNIDGLYPSKNILQKYEFIKCLWSYVFLI